MLSQPLTSSPSMDMKGEELFDIPGYAGLYQITRSGKVFSIVSGRWLSGHTEPAGYINFALYKDGQQRAYKLSRLLALTFIPMPQTKTYLYVDHINRDKTDNRIENLRWLSSSKNVINSDRYKNNTSGRRGVSYNNQLKRWHSRIHVDDKLKHLGFYMSLEDAIAAREKAEKDFFPDIFFKE